MSIHGLPWWNWTLQCVGAACAYLGAELNARLKIQGFYVWLAANVLLCVVHAVSGLWLLCVLDVAYVRVNLAGIVEWKKPRTQAHVACQ